MDILHASNMDAFRKAVEERKGTVLVDFFASWCGPCKMLAPQLEKFASGEETVNIVKVDVDEVREAAEKYGVMSVPTLFLFRDGAIVKSEAGYKNERDIRAFCEA